MQLSAQCLRLPDSLQLAYSQSQNGQQQPTIEDLIAILHQILESFQSSYVFLDALDECASREELLIFISEITGWKLGGLHLLATSRKENDIEASLQGLVTCQVSIQRSLVDADIRVHILNQLSTDQRLSKWPIHVQAEIEDILMKGAQGM